MIVMMEVVSTINQKMGIVMVLTADDCDDEDVGLLAQSEDGDCDGVLTTDDCDDGDAISTIKSKDGDCDGVLTADDCDDNDASL